MTCSEVLPALCPSPHTYDNIWRQSGENTLRKGNSADLIQLPGLSSFGQLTKGLVLTAAWLVCPATLAWQCIQAGRYHNAPNSTECTLSQWTGVLLRSALDSESTPCGLGAQQSPMNVASEDRVVVKPCASRSGRLPPADVPSGLSPLCDSSHQVIHCPCPHSNKENSPLRVYPMSSSGWLHPLLSSSTFQRPLGLPSTPGNSAD